MITRQATKAAGAAAGQLPELEQEHQLKEDKEQQEVSSEEEETGSLTGGPTTQSHTAASQAFAAMGMQMMSTFNDMMRNMQNEFAKTLKSMHNAAAASTTATNALSLAAVPVLNTTSASIPETKALNTTFTPTPAIKPEPYQVPRSLFPLPTFHGKHGEKLERWIGDMETFFDTHGVEDQHWTRTAMNGLRDVASDWWRAERAAGRGQVDWEAFKKGLRQRFGSRESEQTALDQLLNLKQETMSVGDFVAMFSQIRERTPNTEQLTLATAFRRGLNASIAKDLELMMRLKRGTQVTTLEDCITWALEIEQAKIEQARQQQATASQPRHTATSTPTSTFKPLFQQAPRISFNRPQAHNIEMKDGEGELKGLSQDEREKKMKEGRCFKCNEKGHLARNCKPKPKPKLNAVAASVSDPPPANGSVAVPAEVLTWLTQLYASGKIGPTA
jgi:hypothetical protein